MTVKVVLGPSNDDWQTQLAQLAALPPLPVLSGVAQKFIAAFSMNVLRDNDLRQYPELMALAFWFRGDCSKRLSEHLSAGKNNGEYRLARGVVFHLAPSNVDTIFTYSWFLSMLAGNANIVRISSRESPQVEAVLDKVRETANLPEFRAIQERTLIVRYDHDDSVTREFAAVCNVRVIWGGDATVKHMRSIPLPPRATEVTLADRFSLAAFAADYVTGLSHGDFQRFLVDFYNDSFWFNQLACSSPRLLVWVGEPERVTQARARFWPAFHNLVHDKKRWGEKEAGDPGVGLAALGAAFALTATGCVGELGELSTDLPRHVLLTHFSEVVRDLSCGGGFFPELSVRQLHDIAQHLDQRDQSLVVAGIDPAALTTFIAELPRGAIDRIIPVGQALAFDQIWDGQDFLVSFTRTVKAKFHANG